MRQKTILVTGSSRGIGKAIAIHFAQKGYHTFLNCRYSVDELESVRQEITSAGGTCEIFINNVGNPDDVREMFRVIESSYGGVDVLVNNAGIAHIGLLSDMTDAQWDEIIASNLSSAFYCSRAAIPYMVSKKSGTIINISSMWGSVGASCEAAYSASKAGLHGLTKALAKELAPSNIAVNSIACGVIDTAMNNQLTEEERSALEIEIPTGRFGSPEEVAELAYHIANCPAYMTGQIIGIDGGFI